MLMRDLFAVANLLVLSAFKVICITYAKKAAYGAYLGHTAISSA